MNRRSFLELTGSAALLAAMGKVSFGKTHDPDVWTFPILKVDHPNSGGRIYPRSVIQPLVDSYLPGSIHGGLEVPTSGVINLAEVSHQIERLHFATEPGTTDYLYVDVRVLNTPNGKVLRSLLRDCLVDFRPAGIGQARMNEQGQQIIQDGYKFVSIDALPIDDVCKLD